MNTNRKSLLLSMLKASGGLVVFTLGVYMTIQSSIGTGAWEVFELGAAAHLPLSYGDISLIVSAILITIDVLLKEHIGLGTILDAIICGKVMDLFLWLGFIPKPQSPLLGYPMLFAGLFIMAFGQFLYMRTGLGCGPRDSLMIALGKRVRHVPIGAVTIAIQVTVLTLGILLDGPFGVGTVIFVFGLGIVMQITFHFLKFEPRNIQQQDALTSLRILFGKRRQ